MVTPEISIYWALLVFPIAATIGPFMGIGFFPFFFYGVAVLLSAVTVLMGLLKANGFLGRVICLLGAVCWTLLGLLGLGTGS